MNRPFIHVLLYSDPGCGKSTMANTFPDPKLVMFFDPFGKDTPYLRYQPQPGVFEKKTVGELKLLPDGETPYRTAIANDGNLTQIEYYHNLSVEQGEPTAYRRFRNRLRGVRQEQNKWKTLVIDSVTQAELSARKLDECVNNPHYKDPRKWYGASARDMENLLFIELAAFTINVVIVCHIDEDKDEMLGNFVRNPAIRSRGLNKRVASAYSEQYFMYVETDPVEGKKRWLQTEFNEFYMAQTQIMAPNPCVPHYEALWVNWERENNGNPSDTAEEGNQKG